MLLYYAFNHLLFLHSVMSWFPPIIFLLLKSYITLDPRFTINYYCLPSMWYITLVDMKKNNELGSKGVQNPTRFCNSSQFECNRLGLTGKKK